MKSAANTLERGVNSHVAEPKEKSFFTSSIKALINSMT